MIGIGLVLWCRALLFIFKGTPSYNQLKTFYRQLMPEFLKFSANIKWCCKSHEAPFKFLDYIIGIIQYQNEKRFSIPAV
jgi:hypothetical protein